MYIPEFWVGFVVGIAVSIGLLIIAALWMTEKRNKSAPAVLETPRSMATR